MTDALLTLFRCERYAEAFPRGMSVRACLRRQLERQPTTRKGVEGPPRKPFCALECPVGRAHREACEGVDLGACPSCGAALIGAATCDTCEVRRQERSKGPARGFLPPARASESRIIWTGEVPDVPIAPPGAKPPPRSNFTPAGEQLAPGTIRKRPHRAPEDLEDVELEADDLEDAEAPQHDGAVDALATGLRFAPPGSWLRQALETAQHSAATAAQNPAPAAPATPEPPALPAEETPMPKGRRTEPCKGCGTTGSRCKRTCPTKGGGAAPARAKAAPPTRPQPTPLGGPLAAVQELLMKRAEHVEAIAHIDSELGDVQRAIAQAAAEVKAA